MGMAAILVMHVTRTICINFGYPIIRSIHMIFEFDIVVSEKTVWIYWWDSNMSDLGWKVNLYLWNLFIDIVSLEKWE